MVVQQRHSRLSIVLTAEQQVEISALSALWFRYWQVRVLCSQLAWRNSSGRGLVGPRPYCRKHAGHRRFLHRCDRNRGRMDDGTMGTLPRRHDVLGARRGVRVIVRRCRTLLQHCRGVWRLVSSMALDGKGGRDKMPHKTISRFSSLVYGISDICR